MGDKAGGQKEPKARYWLAIPVAALRLPPAKFRCHCVEVCDATLTKPKLQPRSMIGEIGTNLAAATTGNH
jgi:hypothetical protein